MKKEIVFVLLITITIFSCRYNPKDIQEADTPTEKQKKREAIKMKQGEDVDLDSAHHVVEEENSQKADTVKNEKERK